MKNLTFSAFKLLLCIGCVGLLSQNFACKKTQDAIGSFSSQSIQVGQQTTGLTFSNLEGTPAMKVAFNAGIDAASIAESITLTNIYSNVTVPVQWTQPTTDSTLVGTPTVALESLTRYRCTIKTSLKSKERDTLIQPVTFELLTRVDTTDKFPRITTEELLDKVQLNHFQYFWDFAHPTSGLARERGTANSPVGDNTVTSGGSGFGIMALIVGVERNFITRAQGLERMLLIVNFLTNNAQRYHGIYPHWLNGETGVTIPFSTKDNGGDIVETSYLFNGLLCARQYFDGTAAEEVELRNKINTLWQAAEWDWHRKNNENVLYWHWSPNYGWEMNHQLRGWNEALITYVLAASSPTHSIPKIVYDNGWAQNGNMKNGNTYYNLQLPLGGDKGGPLFFSHYSFLGIDPHDLTDQYADYWKQVVNHSLINYRYCVANPKNYNGYSADCWGLTASDTNNGYTAHEPNNDQGVISPTAALSSYPYTPEESHRALEFFYYKMGDKLWKPRGFVDAFNMTNIWYANSHLAIDQGPIVVMIENRRSGLMWDLFMSCPEVIQGMKGLGFVSPRLP